MRRFSCHLDEPSQLECLLTEGRSLQQALAVDAGSPCDMATDLMTVCRGWAEAAEAREAAEGGHVRRVGEFSALLAEAAGLGRRRARRLGLAAMLHDVGKLSVPASALGRPGPLTEGEQVLVQDHARIGAGMLAELRLPIFRLAESVALSHHERWDGKGYPEGAAGSDIPVAGRIVGMADAFDVLTSPRPHKPAYPLSLSVRILGRERGRRFDPWLVDALLANLADFRELKVRLGPDFVPDCEKAELSERDGGIFDRRLKD